MMKNFKANFPISSNFPTTSTFLSETERETLGNKDYSRKLV